MTQQSIQHKDVTSPPKFRTIRGNKRKIDDQDADDSLNIAKTGDSRVESESPPRKKRKIKHEEFAVFQDTQPSPESAPPRTPRSDFSSSPVSQTSSTCAVISPAVAQPPSNDISTTSPAAPRKFQQLPRCWHPRHPAYADTYDAPECPWCQLRLCEARAASNDDLIARKGGLGAWHDQVKDRTFLDYDRRKARYDWIVRGGDKKRSGPLDRHGQDKSHRHHKKQVANLAIELERLMKLECEWKRTHRGDWDALSSNEKDNLQSFSATKALSVYQGNLQEGVFSHIEDDHQAFSRKRGRDMEVASSDPHYPADFFEDSSKRHKWYQITPEQQAIIDNSKVPSVEDADAATAVKNAELPKRKRRRTENRVTFNEEIAALENADVDDFRRKYKPLLTNQNGIPGPAIASRSTPRIKKYSLERRSRHTNFIERTNPLYDPGDWSVTKGSIIVDTSGKKFKEQEYGRYARYVANINHEGEEWDRRDTMDLEAKNFMKPVVKKEEIPTESLFDQTIEGKEVGEQRSTLPKLLERENVMHNIVEQKLASEPIIAGATAVKPTFGEVFLQWQLGPWLLPS